MQSSISDPFHPQLELIQIVYALCLDKVYPCLDFLGQARHPQFEGVGEGVGRRSNEHFGRILDIGTALKFPLIPHGTHHIDKLDGIQVENAIRHGMIAKVWMIAGETQHRVDVVRISAENIALHGQPITVPRYHLQDRVEAHLPDQDTGRQAGHTDHRRLVVRDIDSIDVVPEHFRFFPHLLRNGASRRPTFRSNCQMTRRQNFFQCTLRFHDAKSSLMILRGPPPRPVRQSLAEMFSS